LAVLFISHASRDDAQASALKAWLRSNGFIDIFVDHHSIAVGEKWREELRASAGACRVVLCLATENWLASLECFNEFRAAWYMGKRISPSASTRRSKSCRSVNWSGGRLSAVLASPRKRSSSAPCSLSRNGRRKAANAKHRRNGAAFSWLILCATENIGEQKCGR
jgi:hypothetical protein